MDRVSFKERRSWLTFVEMTTEEMNDNLWINHPEWFKSWFDSEAYHCLYGHRSPRKLHLVDKLHQRRQSLSPGARWMPVAVPVDMRGRLPPQG